MSASAADFPSIFSTVYFTLSIPTEGQPLLLNFEGILLSVVPERATVAVSGKAATTLSTASITVPSQKDDNVIEVLLLAVPPHLIRKKQPEIARKPPGLFLEALALLLSSWLSTGIVWLKRTLAEMCSS